MSREHEMGSVMERIIINANDDNNETSESLATTTMMTQGTGPLSSDRE